MSRDEKRELCYCEECGAVAYTQHWNECRAIVLKEGGLCECRGFMLPVAPQEDADHE